MVSLPLFFRFWCSKKFVKTERILRQSRARIMRFLSFAKADGIIRIVVIVCGLTAENYHIIQQAFAERFYREP